jgi:myo-inositol-1(or 4)-monophosphatase
MGAMKSELDYLAALLLKTADAEILPRFCHVGAERKSDGSLLTEADLAVQQSLSHALALAFPGIPLLGEEMTNAEQQALFAESGRAIWVLDPLDGTSNFACGFPGFGISLALMEQGQPVLGVVLDPVRRECFTAARGKGAWMNGDPIRPFAPGTELGDCLAMVDLKRVPSTVLTRLVHPGGFRSQRSLGSVALEWSWLAAGRFQLYLHGSQQLWDYAAGRLIASEAGACSHQYRSGAAVANATWTLEPCLAVAAANQVLLLQWLAHLGLPPG